LHTVINFLEKACNIGVDLRYDWFAATFEFLMKGKEMGFFDSVAVMCQAGLSGFLLGCVFFFVVLVVCAYLHLEGFWRLGLTLASIVAVCIPEVWQLIFHADDFRNFLEPAISPEALALAIKSKLVLGVVGHLAGLGVKLWLIDR
jgi:hypothetical protein